MSAAIQNVTIEQGATYQLLVTWQDPTGAPIDLTGYRIKSQFKIINTGIIVITADTAVTTAGVTINTPDSTGVIDIQVSASITTTLTGMGVYDLIAEAPSGVIDRLLQGTWSVSNAVTSD
jgi:hypothetical protein